MRDERDGEEEDEESKRGNMTKKMDTQYEG